MAKLKTEVTPLGKFDNAADANRAFDKVAELSPNSWELHDYSEFTDSNGHVHGPTVVIENTTTNEPAVIIYCQDSKSASRLYELLRDKVDDISFAW